MSTNTHSINPRSITLILCLTTLPLILNACQLLPIVSPAQPTPSPTTFSYQLLVQDDDNQKIRNAKAALYFTDHAITVRKDGDSEGLVRFFLPNELQDSETDLVVNANRYLPQKRTVNLYTGQLPDMIQLEPLPFSTQFDFDPGKASETLVLIADFVDATTEQDGWDVTQILGEQVKAQLDGYDQIRIEYLDQVISYKNGDGVAMQIGKSLTIVIWGTMATQEKNEVNIHEVATYIGRDPIENLVQADLVMRTLGRLYQGIKDPVLADYIIQRYQTTLEQGN